MSTENRQEFFVGIAVSLAILILVLGIIWGKGVSVLSRRAEYTAKFETVSGLEEGDPVMIRGTRQGAVKNVRLFPETVNVDFWIQGDIKIFSDAECFVENEELMGGKQLTLEPGHSGMPVQDGRVLEGAVRGDFGRLLGSIATMVGGADSMLTGLRDLIEDSVWVRMKWDAERSVETFDIILTENSRDFREIVTRIDRLTMDLSDASIPERWVRAMDSIERLSSGLDSTVRVINSTMGRLEREEGTVGKLIRDRHLYDQLLRTSAELDSLLQDIKENPKRYVHFSLF